MLRTASHKRKVASFLLLIFLIQTFAPTTAFALTGGPSQPEVQSFEPIGTSEMVDLFSGDFNYNIPLLDMDGYPVNIGYHSGITMDQEASWVGLGWNINPGVINRGMRGIPDDFKGEEITKELNLRPNRTYGVNAGVDGEFFGINGLGIGYTLGVKYNNYNGLGLEQSLSIPISAASNSYGGYSAGLGISSSSDEGLSVQPNVSLDIKTKETENRAGKTTSSLGLNIGASFNSRAGLSQLTISPYTKTIEESTRIGRYGEDVTIKSTESDSKGSASFNFGMPTYTPQVSMPMMNFSLNGNFKIGGELFGFAGMATVGGYFSTQRLYQKQVSNPAYGYIYSESGQYNEDAILDFNREKEGSFTENTPALHLTNFTYDMLSVSGQGVGGSYRPFRNEMAYVFDPKGYSFSDANAVGGEIGVGNAAHTGFNFSVTYTGTRSGKWEIRNRAIDKLQFRGKQNGSLIENFNYAEANEKVVDANNDFFQTYGGYNAQRFILNKRIPFNHGLEDKIKGANGTTTLPSSNFKTKRNKRNQAINTLTKKELSQGLGVENYPVNPNAKDHHIGEITTFASDGMRYVYGIAAYNHFQKDVTFAVGEGLYGSGGQDLNVDTNTGLVEYDGADNSKDNDRGLDNYFSSTTTPAYAHSYLLTSVLSTDYIDIDNIKGPSVGDLGNYTKFNYEKLANDYDWRTPVGYKKASYNEGLKSEDTDEKASYVWGKKDIWYLESIESKNYIAVFTKSYREDGMGVTGENGTIDNTRKLKKLDKISLYTRTEFESLGTSATPIKEVHFEYNYSLCPGVPNSGATTQGKLTLTKIYFTYQNSNKARLSPYNFDYNGINPSYNMKMYDRWGYYKTGGLDLSYNSPISTAEFPYAEQDSAIANTNSAAWTLTDIQLPSGGKIHMDYESDDYGYVQHKRAMQMFQIAGTGNGTNSPNLQTGQNEIPISNCSTDKNYRLYFKVDPNININEYFKGVKDLYFRCLANTDGRIANVITNATYDYVSGYAEIEDFGVDQNNVGYGWVKLKGVKMNDNAPNINAPGNCLDMGEVYNPITKAAIQFGRLYLPKKVWGVPGISDNDGFGSQLLNAMISSNFVKNIKDAVLGPNLALYYKDIGKNIISNKSWIRLNNPNHKKLGGGSRVKAVVLSDEWSTMISGGSTSQNSSYGQVYDYTMPDGSSSGVASYEPQMGGDENPWREPVHYGDKKFLAPDDRFYQEKPYGESFFPSASVGYSKVTVKNLQRANVTKHATGKVVHEFYTAKDFPTLVELTEIEVDRDKFNPFGLGSLLNLKSKDHLAATQGFKVETNDMHGKPKSQKVYQEGKTDPITSVEYFYKSTPYSFETSTKSTEIAGNTFRLENNCSVINPDGTTGIARLGVFYDMVGDMRQSRSETTSASAPFNGDGFLAAIIPIYVAFVIPGFGKEVVQFRSASTTKVIQRFGILEKTVAKDLGSVVSTDNLAYDSETGDVLLTQTTTNFNDKIYNLSYPAHWYYEGMSPAYKNIGYERDLNFNSSGLAFVNNAPAFYTAGDELAIYGSTPYRAWVTNVTANSINVQKKDGSNVNSPNVITKIIRSGRKNLNAVKISSITTLSNPLNSFGNNVFQNVLQASAIEFTDSWKTQCDCFDRTPASTNPFVLGTKGNWKPKRSWLHLSERTQTYQNQNTNIRKDGTFASYTPFYAVSSGKWNTDERNWTYTSEVTEFNPYGQELENKDALGRFSSATFGYKQTMATSVAANTQYRELGFDNFEDYGFSPCADDHFKFNMDLNTQMSIEQSHTGRKSVKVTNGAPLVMTKPINTCNSPNCNLIVKENTQGAYSWNYSISNGIAPYSFEWDIISGDPTINLLSTGGGISINGTSFTVILKANDSQGCKVIQTLNK